MTVLRLRTLIFRTSNFSIPNPPVSTDSREGRSGNWSAKIWALVALFGILAIAGLEGYALSRGIDGVALRAALVSIGVLGGAGIGRSFSGRVR